MKKINKNILSKDELIQQRIKEFNSYFSVILRVHKNFGSIEYDGVERSVYRKKFHRNSTVVILT